MGEELQNESGYEGLGSGESKKLDRLIEEIRSLVHSPAMFPEENKQRSESALKAFKKALGLS